MSSGLSSGQKIECSRDREENGRRELTLHGEATTGTVLGLFHILTLMLSIERKW